MKKLLAILLLIASFAQAQPFKIRNLPTTATGPTTAYIAIDTAGMFKMTVANFLNTYIGGAAVTGSGTQNYVPKWNNAGGTIIGNSLLFDNGTSVSIGTASPTASTAFEVNSTTGALMFPRMTQTQRNALTPLAGMVVHNTTAFTYDGYAAGSWYNFIGTNLTNTATYYPKFVTSTTVGDAILFDSTSTWTVAKNIRLDGLKMPTGAGAAKVLTSDASGVASWATPASSSLTGATGDLISFSATDTKSNITSVSAGSYLRSGGVATLPLWSTLKLPNTATANYIPYATSTNTWGESALLQFNGTTFTANGGTINASGFGFGVAANANAPMNLSVNQNAITSLDVLNSNGGNQAYTRMKITNDASNYIQMTIYGSATTSYGMNASGEPNLYTPVNLNIFADGSGRVIKFAAGGNAEVARFASAGMSVKTTSTPTAYLMLGAGTATASTAPLKFTSGTLLTTPEVGAMNFTTDRLVFTTTTGTTRKDVDLLVYRAITSGRTLDGSDELANCTSGTFTVTLPTAVGFTGQYNVKNIGTGVITIATTSSQTVDGFASGVLTLNQYDSFTLRSNNANWIIIK